MQIELRIDTDRITIDDLIMVDELSAGRIPARQLKEFVARFMFGDGEFLPHEEALQAAGKLSIADLKTAFELMGTKIKELQAAAIPPAIASG